MPASRRLAHGLLIAVLALFPWVCAQSMNSVMVLEQTLCTEDGEKTVTVVMDHDDHGHGAGYDSRCPWCTGAGDTEGAVTRSAALPPASTEGAPRPAVRTSLSQQGVSALARAPPPASVPL